jgi:hypothetical protein
VRFCLIEMPPARGGTEAEVTIVVPGTEKVAMVIPLGALPAFLPLLHEAMSGIAEQRCPACAEPLVTASSPEVDHA